ncbi:hypothetical protein EDC19_1187 [Natranaerovirga hydrolytica]|uniref:Uncharacterized protein n=1 Tax=Natranaerovirga hydrolytica TaxID=680378 RepID=A0A4R1N1G0_9FIRM|nr:hypothetical protein [Natranaerovirga hydrolytica]TCK98752.1 hypothetical protein EDC19_1187 [Natranaerovirga hydrolytica]
MDKKICRDCGEINESSSMFCASCQSSLGNAHIRKIDTSDINIGSGHSRNSTVHRTGTNAVSIWVWIGILFLMEIPLIGLITAMVLAFLVDDETLNNFGRAVLIVSLIAFVILLFT